MLELICSKESSGRKKTLPETPQHLHHRKKLDRGLLTPRFMHFPMGPVSPGQTVQTEPLNYRGPEKEQHSESSGLRLARRAPGPCGRGGAASGAPG